MRKNKKRDFTSAEHQLLGACLAAASFAIRDLHHESVNYYGKTAKVSKRVHAVLMAMENLRAALDDRADYYYSPSAVLWQEESERSVPPEIFLLRVFAGVLKNVEGFLQSREAGVDDCLVKFLNQDQDNLLLLGGGKVLLKRLNEYADEQFPLNRSIKSATSRISKRDRLFIPGRSY